LDVERLPVGGEVSIDVMAVLRVRSGHIARNAQAIDRAAARKSVPWVTFFSVVYVALWPGAPRITAPGASG
jgi:hypothetical protein